MQSHKILHSAQLPNAIPITLPAFSQCSFNSRLAVSEPQNATDSSPQQKKQQQQQSLRAYQPELRLSTSNVNRQAINIMCMPYTIHLIVLPFVYHLPDLSRLGTFGLKLAKNLPLKTAKF